MMCYLQKQPAQKYHRRRSFSKKIVGRHYPEAATVDALQKCCSYKFRKFHRKAPVLGSLFNKVAGLTWRTTASKHLYQKLVFSRVSLRKWFFLKIKTIDTQFENLPENSPQLSRKNDLNNGSAKSTVLQITSSIILFDTLEIIYEEWRFMRGYQVPIKCYVPQYRILPLSQNFWISPPLKPAV